MRFQQIEGEIASLSAQEASLVGTIRDHLRDVSMFSVLPTLVTLREDVYTKLMTALVCRAFYCRDLLHCPG
jgi:hypothetical protein